MSGRGVVVLEDLLEEMAKRHYEFTKMPEHIDWPHLEEKVKVHHREAIKVAVFDFLYSMEMSVAWRPIDIYRVEVRGIESPS